MNSGLLLEEEKLGLFIKEHVPSLIYEYEFWGTTFKGLVDFRARQVTFKADSQGVQPSRAGKSLTQEQDYLRC